MKMIDLKLAEYDLESGKFKSFLEFDDFFLSQDYIIAGCKSNKSHEVFAVGFYEELYERDKKDPLNRFDGLFDGRTYEDGRFVLEINNQDTFFEQGEDKIYHPEEFPPNIRPTNPIIETIKESKKGNLHENPELINLINKSK